MTAKKIPTATIDKTQYRNFYKKAKEFYETMQTSLGQKNWNAAALNAIHTGISINDALLAYFYGIKSISPKHDDAVKLLVSLVKHKEVSSNSAHLRKLIGMKNLVEYEGRLFTQSEAQALAKHAQRFLEWVESLLPQ